MKIVPERSGLDPLHTRDVYYTYDNRGLQTGARFNGFGGEGVTTWYNGFGEPLTNLLNLFGQPRYVTYGHDPNGNRLHVAHPDGTYFSYETDGLDRTTPGSARTGALRSPCSATTGRGAATAARST